MRLGILGGAGGWHLNDLRRAANALECEILPLDYRSLCAELVRDDERLRGDGIDLRSLDGVLVRAMPCGSLEQVVFRMDVLHRLEACGISVINPSRAIETAVDKYLALARVAEKGLDVPRTVTCERATDALEYFQQLIAGREDRGVVVKPLFGSEGRGLRRIYNVHEAYDLFGELEAAGSVIYLQEFIRHPGWDVRALVVGDRIVSCMRRHVGPGDEWRTNIACGGWGEWLHPDAEITELARAASRAVGTQIAGVDLVPGESGNLQIVEVNAAPGWRELAAVCKTDIARHILDYLRSILSHA